MKNVERVGHHELLRLRRIVALLRESSRVTKAELAYASECSEKTIQRGVAVLKADGWPIEYDREGYFLAPRYESDLKASRNQQIAALIMTGCAIDRHLADSFPAVADTIRGELLKLPDLQSLTYHLGSSTIGYEKCSFTEDQFEVFGGLARSVVDGLTVTFMYRAVDQPEAISREVYPMSLRQKDNVWYLFAYDLERKGVRVFTMKKITSVATSSDPFEVPDQEFFDQVEQMGEFSIWDSGEGEKRLVRVKLWEHAADFVRTHLIHSSQSVEVLGDGSVILSVETSDLTGVKLWLRKFLHLAELLEPSDLKLGYISDLREALRLYGE